MRPIWARRDEGEYRQYTTEEQRSQAGCSAGRMQLDFHHGLLGKAVKQVNHHGLVVCGRRLGWVMVPMVLLVGVGTLARTQEPEPPVVPWFETRAPGAFGDSRAAASQEWAVAFRVDATVRLPLLIAKIPIVSRESVGVTTFTARYFTTDRRTGVRAYEFYAASFPDRARGLNRLGFLREAVVVARTGIIETAQFGVISSEREDSMAKVEEVLDNDAEVLPYSVIDTLITADAADSRVLQLLMSGQWDTAAGLYDEVRPQWDGEDPTYIRHLSNDDPSSGYEAPLAFFSGLQVSMQAVADAVAAGEDPRNMQRYQPYVHNGRLLRFELRKIARDEKRAKEYARGGWLEHPEALRRLEYRLRDARGKEVDRFKLWVELRASSPEDPFPRPHLPVAYEYEPAGYLRLRAVRVPVPGPASSDRR